MGPTKKEKQAQKDIRNRELSLSDESLRIAREDREKADELMEPAITRYKALSSGDPEAIMTATAPMVSELDDQYQASRAALERALPPGPVRDAALAKLERERGASLGGIVTRSVSEAPDRLAGFGSTFLGTSLNEKGAGIRTLEGASATQSSILRAEAAGRAATLGFLGDLAGAGGYAAGIKLGG